MNLQCHVIGAVFRRNFSSYFSNPIGYLFLTAFVWASAYFAFWHNDAFFTNNLADLEPLNEYFPYLLLFFIPAIAMTAWAEERRSGTEELLLTLPASDLEIVLGKFAACVAIYSVSLAYSFLVNIIVLKWLGDPDWGLLVSTYIGYWFMGTAMLAGALTASLLTSSVTVAFILGVFVCLIMVSVNQLSLLTGPSGATAREILNNSGAVPQFAPFGKGLISLKGVFYFLSIIVVMLYLNIVLLGRRHWAGSKKEGEHWFHSLTRAAALIVATVSVTLLANRVQAYIYYDASDEKLHSISPSTVEVLNAIDPNRPVFIEAYISQTVPKNYVNVRRDLIDLLNRYDAMGGGKVEVVIHNTEPFTAEARNAKKVYNIEPQPVLSLDDGRRQREDIFLAVAVKSGLNEKVIPFFDRGSFLEYELTRTIRTVAEKTRRKVGILTTDAQLFGSFNMQMMQPGQNWQIIDELQKQYSVEQVSPDIAIDEKIDCLIVPLASSLTQTQLGYLIDYVKAGRPTLIFDDPMPLINPRLAAKEQKQSQQQNPMFGGQPPATPKGNLGDLTRILNVELDVQNVVWQDWNPHPEYKDLPPEYVFIGKGSGGPAFDQENPITSRLQELIVMYAGSIRGRGSDGPSFTSLMTLSRNSGNLAWNDVFTNSMFGGGGQLNRNPRRRLTRQEYTVAAWIHGPFEKSPADAFPPDAKDEKGNPIKPPPPKDANVVFICDLDMISDMFFEIRRGQTAEAEKLSFDNITFVLNCVDFLAGEKSLVDLRKRRAERRTLDLLEQMTRSYDARARSEEEKAGEKGEKELAAAKARFDESVDAIDKRTDIDERTKAVLKEAKRRTEQRKLDVRTSEIEHENDLAIQEIRDNLQSAKRAEQRKIKLFAVIFPAIPVLLVGVGVFFARIQGEREGVNPNRLV